jgi:hypothetical protein
MTPASETKKGSEPREAVARDIQESANQTAREAGEFGGAAAEAIKQRPTLPNAQPIRGEKQ